MLYKHRMLTSPSDRELQESIDLTTGFAMPVVKMSHFGDALKGAEDWKRKYLRELVSSTNQFPNVGPQNLAERVDTLKYFVNLPSKLHKRMGRLFDDFYNGDVDEETIAAATGRVKGWIESSLKAARGTNVGANLKVVK